MKEDIKYLYTKNPKLATRVAEVLGYKITIRAKKVKKTTKPRKVIKNSIKDILKRELGIEKLGKEYEEWLDSLPKSYPTPKDIEGSADSILEDLKKSIQKVLNIKTFSIKKNPSKKSYTYKDNDKYINIVADKDFKYTVVIPHIESKKFKEIDIDEGFAFMKQGTAATKDELFRDLNKIFNQILNYLKIRGFKFDQKGMLAKL